MPAFTRSAHKALRHTCTLRNHSGPLLVHCIVSAWEPPGGSPSYPYLKLSLRSFRITTPWSSSASPCDNKALKIKQPYTFLNFHQVFAQRTPEQW
jgi:hypothetical protein